MLELNDFVRVRTGDSTFDIATVVALPNDKDWLKVKMLKQESSDISDIRVVHIFDITELF